MTTEPGEAQPTEAESFPGASTHSTPKQVEALRTKATINNHHHDFSRGYVTPLTVSLGRGGWAIPEPSSKLIGGLGQSPVNKQSDSLSGQKPTEL